MGLKRWTGSAYADVSLAKYGANTVPKNAYVWDGSAYKKVWPVGVTSDAAIYLDFNDSSNYLFNKGDATNPLVPAGAMSHAGDHAVFGVNGRIFNEPTSTWANGFTLSMWTRDTPANSGWKTIMHRAMPTGTLTNEAYIVHNTSATTTTTVSGLKFGSTHREFSANYSLPVGADWFHTVVVWERTSATTFQCRFYINGVSRGIFDGTGYSSTDQFTTEELYIGGNRTSGEWSGRMDDLVMWRRALSDSEVTSLYNQGRSSLPAITTYSLNEMMKTSAFSQQLTADFTVTSWSATGLPAGLSLSSSGLLSGTPTTEGSGVMAVTATGAGGIVATTNLNWSVLSNLTTIPFNSNADIDNYFPIRGFDARTSASSPRNPAFTFSGMLVAGDNNVATYWQALLAREINSESCTWTMVMGDVMNTIDRPTEIILSSDANLQNQLLVQIGSASIGMYSRTTGSTTQVRAPFSRTIAAGSVIEVTRNGLTYTVKDDGVTMFTFTGSTSSAAGWFRTAGRGYTGVTMFSTSGQWSSRVANYAVQQG